MNNFFKSIGTLLSLTVLSLTVSGCHSKAECYHYGQHQIVSDTATCTQDGILTERCVDCGATWTSESYAKGHNWKVVSDTSTCTESGVKDSECTRCNETKHEEVPAKGHSYDSYDICRHCKEWKYNFELQHELPYSVGWKSSKSYYTKCDVLEISFKSLSSDKTLYSEIKIKKTYDNEGENGTHLVEFKVKIVSEDGEVFGIIDAYATDIAVGQTYTIKKYTQLNTRDLDVNKRYLVTLHDYS